MTPPDSLPPTPTPSPLDGLPETEASRAIRSTVAEVIGTLQRLHATLAVEAGRLTEEERRSGQGKLLDGEAAVAASVGAAGGDGAARDAAPEGRHADDDAAPRDGSVSDRMLLRGFVALLRVAGSCDPAA